MGLLVSCRLSWRRSCWKRDRVICLSIGRNLVLMMRKRKLFSIRFGVFVFFFGLYLRKRLPFFCFFPPDLKLNFVLQNWRRWI